MDPSRIPLVSEEDHGMIPLQFRTVLLLGAMEENWRETGHSGDPDRGNLWESAAHHSIQPALRRYAPGVLLPPSATHAINDWVIASEPYRGNAYIALMNKLSLFSNRFMEDYLGAVVGPLALWILDLPASESNHHSYPFGLIDHLLEVALGALKKLSRSVVETCPSPSRAREWTWVQATLMVSLLHDCGKLLDIEVRDPKSGNLWDPLKEPLAFFKSRHGLPILGPTPHSFRPGRGLNAHEGKGRLLAPLLLPSSMPLRMRGHALQAFDAYLGRYDQPPKPFPPPLDFIADAVQSADGESARYSQADGQRFGKALRQLTAVMEEDSEL